MIVFRYDKTFEGLLTAVFDAYARRMWPDMLLAEGEPAPLFTDEDHTVVTDPRKSERVWRALAKKLPKDVCNMLMMGWLSEEPGVDMMLARYIRRVFGRNGSSTETRMSTAGRCGKVEGDNADGDKRDVLNVTKVWMDFSDPDILRVKQLALKVSYEREHIMQFTRFQKGADTPDSLDTPAGPDTPDSLADDPAAAPTATRSRGAGATYFAPVLPLAVPYFRDRFRDQKWLIYDIGRHYGYYYDLHEVTEITMEDDAHLTGGRIDPTLLAEGEELFQAMWKKYIDSMAIKERINPRLQRQHMPRRFWPLLTEMQ